MTTPYTLHHWKAHDSWRTFPQVPRVSHLLQSDTPPHLPLFVWGKAITVRLPAGSYLATLLLGLNSHSFLSPIPMSV